MILWLLACQTVEPPVPRPAQLLSLTPTTMTTPDGTLHGGEVVSFHQQTAADVALGPGLYTLSVLAGATDVNGEPGVLEAHVGDERVASLSVPPGSPRWIEAVFGMARPTFATLHLRFTNDHHDADGDRNLRLDRVRLTRTAAPPPEQRAAQLRDSLAGSNLVLISLDTLRPDHLSAYGYHRETSPNIDALAASGVRLDGATAASHWTAPSHATLLSGLHPSEHGVTTDAARMSPDVTTLAEVLSEAGWRTGGFTGSYFVTELLGLRQGFETWAEQPAPCSEGFAAAIDWMQAQEAPFFLFAHTYQTHAPYSPPPPNDRMFTPAGPLPKRAVTGQFRSPGPPPTPAELEALIGLYDGEIRTADDCVGELVEALGERRDRTLVVITSDHGEQFMEHGGFGHGRLLPVLLRVPLILSHPLLRTAADAALSQPTGAVDVVPTLLDLLGVEPPPGLSGQSLVPMMTGTPRPSPVAFSSSSVRGEHAALRDSSGHFVRLADGERLLESDPVLGEHDALHSADPARLDAYRSALADWQASTPLRATPHVADFSDESLEALRALGYLRAE